MQRRLRQPSHAAPSASTIVHARAAAHTHLTAPIGYARASQVRIELLVSAGDDSEDAGALFASYDALAILLLPLLCGLSRPSFAASPPVVCGVHRLCAVAHESPMDR